MSCLQCWRGEEVRGLSPSPPLPEPSEVRARTDLVTRRIQELWAAMVENKREMFLPCAVRIRAAVADLAVIFPQVLGNTVLPPLVKTMSLIGTNYFC